MTDTVALALVALEVDEPLDALAARLGAEVMYGPAGVRYVDAGLATELIDAHRQRATRRRAGRRAGIAALRSPPQLWAARPAALTTWPASAARRHPNTGPR